MRITKAAITPGTHPQSHNKKTISIEPQPLSMTANGGQIIERSTLQKLIVNKLLYKLILIYHYDAITRNLLQRHIKSQ